METLRGLRVAHLIESDGPGGAERMVASLAAALQDQGAENLVIGPAGGEGWLAEELEGTGVAVALADFERPFTSTAAHAIADLLRRHRATVAHSHEFTMGVAGAWGARRAGVAHLFTMHGSRYYAERWRRRIALRLAAACSGAVVAVSQSLAHSLRRDLWLGESQVTRIPNGARLEPAAESSLRRELGLGADDQLALAVGNLYPVKGHRYLVEALGLLAERFPRLHLVIAGRGEEETNLRRQAAALGVERRVHLLGLRRDVANLLAGADLFVLPSLSEGLPLALIEAMLARRPVVASGVGEIPTVLDGGRAGVTVPPGNPAALADAITTILVEEQKARGLAAAGQRRARELYSLPAMVQRYVSLYGAILGPGAAEHATGAELAAVSRAVR